MIGERSRSDEPLLFNPYSSGSDFIEGKMFWAALLFIGLAKKSRLMTVVSIGAGPTVSLRTIRKVRCRASWLSASCSLNIRNSPGEGDEQPGPSSFTPEDGDVDEYDICLLRRDCAIGDVSLHHQE